MTDADKPRFLATITALGEYYQRTLSPMILGLYWEGLKRFDLHAIEDAAGRHISAGDAGQFMPKVADLAKLLEGSGSDAALVAWAKVDRAVRTVGTYASVVFDDPIIHAVVSDMGGWAWFGRQTSDEWPFVAKQFETRYRGFRTRGDVGTYPSVLIGLAEADNSRMGLPSERPKLLGNPDQAVRVMQGGSASSGLLVTTLDLDKAVRRLEQRATA